jgi:hypothetical protein
LHWLNDTAPKDLSDANARRTRAVATSRGCLDRVGFTRRTSCRQLEDKNIPYLLHKMLPSSVDSDRLKLRNVDWDRIRPDESLESTLLKSRLRE